MEEKISSFILSYAAAIVDGEGSIMIKKARPSGRRINANYSLQIAVANTDRRLIEFFFKHFGGWWTNTDPNPSKNKRRLFRWDIKGKPAAKFIELIFNFLVIKKRQAELGLEFIKSFDIYYGCFGIPQSVLESRENLFLECRRLKNLTHNPL